MAGSTRRKTNGFGGMIIAIAAFACLFAPGSADAGSHGKLNVSISTVRSSHGAVFVALYDRAHWLKPGQFKAYRRVPARQGTVSVAFDGMETGKYALAVFHDENGNGKVDTNFLGLPAEGFGFSKLTPFRKPSFDETAFDVHGAVSMPVRLKY